MNNRILRMDEVYSLVSLSRATIYRLLKENDFPDKVKLSERSIGFRLQDIQKWIENR